MTHHAPQTHGLLNSGALYVDFGPGREHLEVERQRGKELADTFNATAPSDVARREALLADLFATVGEGVWVEPPLHVSYGVHTRVGSRVYANFNLVLVDDADITIGDDVMFAPNVTLATAGHPLDPELRATGQQFSLPIVIEDKVWIGANVVVLPGVTIGEGSVIGAGSVVSQSIPPRVVAVGSPARVLRRITEADRDFAARLPTTAPIPD